MNTQAIRYARLLGWGGVAPFLAWPVIVTVGAPDWLILLVKTYAIVILAFMAGTLWMRQIGDHEIRSSRLFISNGLALLAWPAILLPGNWAAAWLAILFAAHLVVDQPWRPNGLPGWYRRLRAGLSSSVITLLTLAAVIGFGRGF